MYYLNLKLEITHIILKLLGSKKLHVNI